MRCHVFTSTWESEVCEKELWIPPIAAVRVGSAKRANVLFLETLPMLLRVQ